MTACPTRRAITLTETLFAVVALLFAMAVVVPERGSMDRRKQRQECAYKLGLLAKAASHYSMANDGWILGSPNSTGAYLLNRSVAYGPAVQIWDFMGPLAEFYNFGFTLPPESGDQAAVAERFNQIRNAPEFHCPANGFIARQFPTAGSPDAGSGPMISYNTTRNQLFRQTDDRSALPGLDTYYNEYQDEWLPSGYVPRIDRLGDLSRKIWIADGARWSSPLAPPDFDLFVRARYGGAFSDVSSYSQFSYSWNRSGAPGNSTMGGVDARIYAFRHANAAPPEGAPGDAFKLNLAFYDTHVETQGDLTSSNPHQWLPTGTLVVTRVRMWRDTILHFGLPTTFTIN